MALLMTIKNTFVHLDMAAGDASAERRCSSVPRSLRLAPETSRLKYEEFGKQMSSRAPSTCEEVSTAAELSERDASVGGEDDTTLTPPLTPTGSTPKIHQKCGSALTEAFLLAPPACSFGLAEEATPPPPEAPPRQRLKLNSKAQAWTPEASAVSHHSATVGFIIQQIAAVVAATVGALQQGLATAAVEASEGPAGWSLVVTVPLAEFQQQREQVLANACQALLGAACSRGGGVHVLGSMATPFIATPFGCSAMLGAVADENKACWDAVACGFCHRGRNCRWEHPICRVTVNIMVKIADSS
mmetsp:Transcript_23420/g.66284  ORF Transcript_23420/g.66284 Transcript_23420/m.66284 type:complete len:301 (-) Transcript_23420:238-1140(-)